MRKNKKIEMLFHNYIISAYFKKYADQLVKRKSEAR